jgi:hypothetical protein
MAVSTKQTAQEMQKFVSNPGAEVLFMWMAAIHASILALAEQVDADRGSGTDAVDALTVEE